MTPQARIQCLAEFVETNYYPHWLRSVHQAIKALSGPDSVWKATYEREMGNAMARLSPSGKAQLILLLLEEAEAEIKNENRRFYEPVGMLTTVCTPHRDDAFPGTVISATPDQYGRACKVEIRDEREGQGEILKFTKLEVRSLDFGAGRLWGCEDLYWFGCDSNPELFTYLTRWQPKE